MTASMETPGFSSPLT